MKHSIKIIIAVLFVVNYSLSAQISEYTHPPTIMGQEILVAKKNATLEITPELLVIHDVDEADFSTYTVTLESGDNYTFSGNVVTPATNYTGMLYITATVYDGKHTSDAYTLEAEITDISSAYSYSLDGQYLAKTNTGISFEITPDHLKLAKVSTNQEGVFYIAPDGDDTNEGTIDAPLKTISAAKTKVETYKTQNGIPANGITVFFREGNYYLESTVEFDAGDSGEKGKYITYRAYPHEKVSITGAKRIDYSWMVDAPSAITNTIKDANARAKIKMVDLKSNGITQYGIIDHVGYGVSNKPIPPANIFIDGKAMHLSRYPNSGNIDDTKSPIAAISFISKSGVVNTWNNTGDIWIDGAMSKPWEWQKNKIVNIESNGLVTMQWNYHSDIGQVAPKMFYFNIIEELDAPEEFFIDRSNGLLYIYPPENLNAESDIIISQSAAKLISLKGTKYIKFVDLKFEGTRNSAIEMKNNASYNKIINCEVGSCGLDGVTIYGTNNQVINTHVHDIGANGVNLNGGNESTLEPARNLVENCEIHDFSQERRAYNPGIKMFGIGQVLRFVELYNGPHMSLDVKGNNHVVEYCDFHHAPNEYSDMLGIYFNTGNFPLSRGTIIRKNKFRNVSGTWKQSAGIYLDNETSGVIIEENYFYDNIADESGWSVMIHGGADNIVRKNVFVYCSYPFSISLRLNGYAAGDFEGRLDKWESEFSAKATPKYFELYPELNRFFDDEGITPDPMTYKFEKVKDANGIITNYWDRRTPSSNVFEDNMVYNERSDIFAMPASSSSRENRGYYVVNAFRKINGIMQENLISENNHNLTSDPGFVDYKNRNLTIKPNSSLLTKLPHLSKIPFDTIGLKARVGVQFNDFKPVAQDNVSIEIQNNSSTDFTFSGATVSPEPAFNGELSVPIIVKVGDLWESAEFDFKILVGDNLVNVKENKEIDGLKVYPNPAGDVVYIEASQNSMADLYNSSGFLVKKNISISDNTSISISDLSLGVYFLIIKSKNKNQVVKLIKN